MSLVKRTVSVGRGEFVLNDDGSFKTAYGFTRVGVWDDELNEWAEPPYDRFDKEYTLEEFKVFVAGLSSA